MKSFLMTKSFLAALAALLLGGACYFAFSNTGEYGMEGTVGGIPDEVPEDTLGVDQDFGAGLAHYHCHNPWCLHEWIDTPGGMPCPKCSCLAEDFDLIGDDDLD